MKTRDVILTDFHHGIAVTQRALFRALRETVQDFDARTALVEARQIIAALLETRQHG